MNTAQEARRSPQSDSSEPLFASTHSALKFALNFTHGTLARPMLAQLLGGGSLGRGLVGLDGAAQAGMILAELERLMEVRRAMLVARFAESKEYHLNPCLVSCCRGWVWAPTWEAAIDRLTRYVHEEGLGGTVSHYRLRRAMVTRHFGIRESLLDIAAASGVERHAAGSYFKRVTERFKGQEKLAFDEIDGYLKQAGVVEI